MSEFAAQCQSCGLPLKDGTMAGTEKDGTKCREYCEMCYSKGRFCSPQMSVDEMQDIVNQALKKRGWIAPLRWLALWQVPTLKRWKKR